MLRYVFSTREKVLIVVLTCLLLAGIWYLLVVSPCAENRESAAQEYYDLQADIGIAQTQLSKMNAMQNEIDEVYEKTGGNPVAMPQYDNVENIIAELNVILLQADDYTLAFDALEYGDDGIVRRGINLNYGTKDYATARTIIDALDTSRFRNQIDTVSIGQTSTSRGSTNNAIVLNMSNEGTMTDSTVNVSVHLTFFEST